MNPETTHIAMRTARLYKTSIISIEAVSKLNNLATIFAKSVSVKRCNTVVFLGVNWAVRMMIDIVYLSLEL